MAGIFFEYFAQDGNILREIHFFDKGVWPHLFEQLFFVNDAPATLNQCEERIEVLGGERHKQAVAQKDTLVHIQ